MSYTKILRELDSIVAKPSWPAIPTFPVEKKDQISVDNFIKFEILFLNAVRTGYAKDQTRITGIVVAQLYYPGTKSKREVINTVEAIKLLLEDQNFLTSSLQTFTASLKFLGNDPKNTTLKRADISVPFTYIGE